MDRSLPKSLNKNSYFTVEVKECKDGSGDCYIELDEHLLNSLDWREGDELTFKIQGESLIIRNATLEIRKDLKS